MTKLAFKAQVIFETGEWSGFGGNEPIKEKGEITFTKIKEAINEGKIDVEMIGSETSYEQHPVLIIRYKVNERR